MEGVHDKRFFISRRGRHAGPFSKDQLRALNINAETSVWDEKAFAWKKAGTLEELRDLLNASPLPKVRRGPLQWLRIGRKRAS
jgi:hypothetical protein